ncbi:ester cyclase [Nonomuraea sp. FMUSA5-5]|uniref:Ester cyclase n=1 Tax=Nonomuraea composti TaxID=2720023 RepID=A0ABX1AYC8_9ACTN|nr:ester cyclase [Nonomuraea sp. FMUSA5-5]NJP89345.1 ester cyclase [Nonomuraea sp. FMUSA5-5]
MAIDVEALLRLWTHPLPPDDEAAAAAFRAYYTDPVLVNGSPMPASELVSRARAVQAMFEDVRQELLEVFQTPDKLVLVARSRGKHVGPMATSAGLLKPTGRFLDLRVIDVMTLTDGRISAVWMTADELGALKSIDAVTLTQP